MFKATKVTLQLLIDPDMLLLVEKDVTRELRYLNSFRFMPSSLDKLSKNLQRDQFINLKKYFGDKKKFDLGDHSLLVTVHT